MRWVYVDEKKRVSYLSRLLLAIRYGLLPPRFIREKLLESRLLVDHGRHVIRDVESIIVASLDAHKSPGSVLSGRASVMATLRSGMIKPEFCLLLVGGRDTTHPSINCYNPMTRETYYIADVLSDDRDRPGYYSVINPACVVTDDNQLYLAGGSYIFHDQSPDRTDCDDDSFDDFDDDVVGRNFYIYDGDHNRWVARSPMLFPKSSFALVNVFWWRQPEPAPKRDCRVL